MYIYHIYLAYPLFKVYIEIVGFKDIACIILVILS